MEEVFLSVAKSEKEALAAAKAIPNPPMIELAINTNAESFISNEDDEDFEY
jgi:hypothetical protein